MLGAHGAAVVMASRKQERARGRRRRAVGAQGLDVSFGVCDVRDADAVRAVVDGVVADRGALDIVVNNAAGNFPAPMSAISPNGFKAVVDIDLLGTYNVTRAAFDAWLRDHGGSIVNISAPFEQRGVVYQAHVAAAKSGVDSLTRTLRGRVGPLRHPGQRHRPRLDARDRGPEAVRRGGPGRGHRRSRPTRWAGTATARTSPTSPCSCAARWPGSSPAR